MSASKWVSNVFEQGMLGMGLDRAARLQPGGGIFLTNFPPLFGLRLFVSILVTGQVPYVLNLSPVPDPFGPFPYGVDVEPPD